MERSRLAVVTGGGRGIGAAIAAALAESGATVVVADIDKASAVAIADEIGPKFKGIAIGVGLDVADRVSCERLAREVQRQFGDISILINNAGINRRMAVDDRAAADAWDEVMSINVTGAFNVANAFLEQLKNTGGTIVNLASVQSYVHLRGAVAYSASKGAVSQLTKALAVELAPWGVRVNAIAPGLTVTEMTAPTRANELRMTSLMDRIPLKRFATPQEIAAPALFLTSSAASYITGTVLVVDGGYLTL